VNDWALRYAACYGYAQTVKVLLAAGADVHVWDDTALCSTALRGHTETVQTLLASGADVHAEEDWALRGAARNGHTETVKVLLAFGANVHAQDDWALHWAARNGHTEMVRVLQEAIKNQNAQRLELERQQNPLSAGTGLIFAESGPEDVETLLRDAVVEQSFGVSALRATGSQPERPDGREHIPLPLCP
jgi:ankyrin repeat protein